MKKLLLGSTALVAGGLMAAPAMAADPIKIGVGGYWTGYVLAGSMDSIYALDGSTLDYKGLNLIYEGEIHFIGSTKLDNGTTVGVTVELEAHNPSQVAGGVSTAAQIDESFLFALSAAVPNEPERMMMATERRRMWRAFMAQLHRGF